MLKFATDEPHFKKLYAQLLKELKALAKEKHLIE